MEEITDLEMKREEAIAHAKCMLNYHVSEIKRRYDADMDAAEQDYDTSRQSLHDAIMAAIDDRRKQIREDKDNGLDINDLLRDAYHRIHHTKRNLRKRQGDRNQINASPSRTENPKRRQTRPNNQASLSGSLNQREEDELDQDYGIMKGSKQQPVLVQ
ncbi:hypothetical protein BX666DRAFT_556735 [Dichotomocladium elegans]|nr:hypothetical protein BX666DRAFT_556735 [Dichotomocladium elegans]